jgi:hypothetical protein
MTIDAPPLPASFLRTGLAKTLAPLVVAGCLAACDVGAEHQGSNRDIELEDESPSDDPLEVLEALAAEAEDEGRDFGGVAELVVVDSNGNGAIDRMDDLVPMTDPVAIGEMGCATQILGNPIHGATLALSGWVTSADIALSPSTGYGTGACPDQYVVEVTGTYDEPLTFLAHRFSLQYPSALVCSLTEVDVTAYGAAELWNGMVLWGNLGSTSLHGVWDGDSCDMEPDVGQSEPPSLEDHSFFKVRVAARARILGVKQQVYAGVFAQL